MQLDKISILVVDDRYENLELLRAILGDDRTHVFTASNGPDALRSIKENPPDLILLDIKMPEMDGYEICRRIKNDHDTSDIPIIFISAIEDELDMVKGFNLGAVDYISKPYRAGVVKARVKTHLMHHKTVQALERINKQLSDEIEKRKKLEEELRELTRIDELTQLANRRVFDEEMMTEWRRAMRTKSHVTLLMIDVDYFKNLNDSAGHQTGDKFLIQLGYILKKYTRRFLDTAARYGGEEFAVILSEAKEEDGYKVAEMILKDVERVNFKHSDSKVCDHVTVSIGVAGCIPEYGSHEEVLIERADKALYKAKNEGRNRVARFN